MEPSSVAGTGTLWAGGVVAESSLGGSQMGAVASRVPGEGTMSLSRGPGWGVGGVQGQDWVTAFRHPVSGTSPEREPSDF